MRDRCADAPSVFLRTEKVFLNALSVEGIDATSRLAHARHGRAVGDATPIVP